MMEAMAESRKYHSYRTAEVRVMEETKYDVNYNIDVDIFCLPNDIRGINLDSI